MWLGSTVAVVVAEASAVAPIRPLAWGLPNATGAAVQRESEQTNRISLSFLSKTDLSDGRVHTAHME